MKIIGIILAICLLVYKIISMYIINSYNEKDFKNNLINLLKTDDFKSKMVNSLLKDNLILLIVFLLLILF